jgi:hypothetical protein
MGEAARKVMARYLSDTAKDSHRKEVQKQAELSAKPHYYLNMSKPKVEYPLYRMVHQSGEFSAASVLSNTAFYQATRTFLLQKHDHWWTMAENARALARSRTLLKGLGAKTAWENKNRGFARRRTKVARQCQDIKAKAVTDPEGLLNFGKRLDALKQSFQQDFRDALARLRVVRQGLGDIYGYEEPFPENEQSIDYFDDCLLWTRKAIQWLIRFARQEQSFVLPISIRDTVGDSNWQQGLKTGSWQAYLPDTYFDALSMVHVRLRGIGAVVKSRSRDDERLWQIEVRVPDQSQIKHLPLGETRPLDQSAIPPCILGRVTGRESRRDPDVVGSSALHNASPINAWTVKVLASVPYSEIYVDLEDIVLDLHLSFRYLEKTNVRPEEG